MIRVRRKIAAVFRWFYMASLLPLDRQLILMLEEAQVQALQAGLE